MYLHSLIVLLDVVVSCELELLQSSGEKFQNLDLVKMNNQWYISNFGIAHLLKVKLYSFITGKFRSYQCGSFAGSYYWKDLWFFPQVLMMIQLFCMILCWLNSRSWHLIHHFVQVLHNLYFYSIMIRRWVKYWNTSGNLCELKFFYKCLDWNAEWHALNLCNLRVNIVIFETWKLQLAASRLHFSRNRESLSILWGHVQTKNRSFFVILARSRIYNYSLKTPVN